MSIYLSESPGAVKPTVKCRSLLQVHYPAWKSTSPKDTVPDGISLSHCSLQCLWDRSAPVAVPKQGYGVVCSQFKRDAPVVSERKHGRPEWRPLSCLQGGAPSEPGLSDRSHTSAGAQRWAHQQPRITLVAILSVIIQKGKQKVIKHEACAPVQQRISWKSFTFLNDIIMYALFSFHHFYQHFLAEAQTAWLG